MCHLGSHNTCANLDLCFGWGLHEYAQDSFVMLNVGQHSAVRDTAESYRQNLQHEPAINAALECAKKKVIGTL